MLLCWSKKRMAWKLVKWLGKLVLDETPSSSRDWYLEVDYLSISRRNIPKPQWRFYYLFKYLWVPATVGLCGEGLLWLFCLIQVPEHTKRDPCGKAGLVTLSAWDWNHTILLDGSGYHQEEYHQTTTVTLEKERAIFCLSLFVCLIRMPEGLAESLALV